MARYQIYRGDPEQKLYFVLNSFSGGINTTDSDEFILDDEVRYAENAELLEQGLIQNRRGFADLTFFNDAVEDDITLKALFENHDILLIKNIKDEGNYFERCVDNGDFLSEYDFQLLFASYITDELHFTIARFTDTDGVNIVSEKVLDTTNITFNRLTGAKTVDFENNVYMILNQFDSSMEGFIGYSLEDEVFKVYSQSENTYVPSPYEVTNVGFNVFLDNPLEIQYDASGIPELRGAYITPVNEPTKIINRIPDERFWLHVIYKGSTGEGELNLIDQLELEAYTEDGFGEKSFLDIEYEKENDDTSKGILLYEVSVSRQGMRNDLIFLRIKKDEALDVNFDIEFETKTDMVDFYKNIGKNYLIKTGFDSYTVFKPKTTTYGYDIYETDEIFVFENFDGSHTFTLSKADGYLENIPFVQFFFDGSYAFYYGRNQKFSNKYTFAVIDFGVTSPRYQIGVVKYDGNGYPTWGYTFTNFDPEGPYANINDIPTFNTISNYKISELTPNINTLIKISGGEEDIFYRWNGGQSGGYTEGEPNDFDEEEDVEVSETVMSFVVAYLSGKPEDIKEAKPLVTNRSRALQYQNRLMLYAGNTLVFSDPFKFNYFPNYNYITLSLEPDDSIQSINYFRGSHIIFTKERIYRISGTLGMEDFKIVLINDVIGCVSPDSVRSINNTLVFLSKDGLYTIKQNFYMDGLENVEKIDRQIEGLIPYGTNYESLLYNEQYMLFLEDKTIKMYYNMERNVRGKKHYPFLVDKYAKLPRRVLKIGTKIYGIRQGRLYLYDSGYTDFEPYGLFESTEAGRIVYFYKFSVLLPNVSLGFPTHDKKLKNLFVKNKSPIKHPIYFTVAVDDMDRVIPYQFVVRTNDFGELVYEQILLDSEFVTGGGVGLGEFRLDVDYLGGKQVHTHKVVVSEKGRNYSVRIDQYTDTKFVIQDIGFLFKLGKVRAG